MKIFINKPGAATPDTVELDEDSTVEEALEEVELDPSKYTLLVNKATVESDHKLDDGDMITLGKRAASALD